MDMGSAVPDWLTPVAWTYLTISLVSATVIALDVHRRRGEPRDLATDLVWIASGLYLGPVAVVAHRRAARTTTASGDGLTLRSTAVAALPGGGASAVAHLVAVPLVAAVGWTIAGMAMWPMILVIAVLAIAMLAVYERVAGSGPRTGPSRTTTVGGAVAAAVVTVVAFDVGMVGWMLLLDANGLMPPITDGTFWFLMQVGVVAGLVTGFPAVRWLLRRNRVVVPA